MDIGQYRSISTFHDWTVEMHLTNEFAGPWVSMGPVKLVQSISFVKVVVIAMAIEEVNPETNPRSCS